MHPSYPGRERNSPTQSRSRQGWATRREGTRGSTANPVEIVILPVDRWQKRHGPVAFVFAVVKKFGDDCGGTLCALITFYGFLSLFPLLLLGLTVLALVAGPGSHTYLD